MLLVPRFAILTRSVPVRDPLSAIACAVEDRSPSALILLRSAFSRGQRQKTFTCSD